MYFLQSNFLVVISQTELQSNSVLKGCSFYAILINKTTTYIKKNFEQKIIYVMSVLIIITPVENT